MLRTGSAPLLFTLLIVACAPPPEVVVGETATPAVSIVVPPLSPQPTISLDVDCNLPIDIVVDVDNFEFVSPGFETENVDGHGHFHLNGGAETPLDGYYVAPKAQLQSLLLTDADLVGGKTLPELANGVQIFSIVASAQTNTHEAIDGLIDDCPGCRSTLEFTITKGDCLE